MNNIQRNPNERGSAILLVLGFLSLLLMMAMIFATTGRNAQIVADAKADETNAQLQSRSAVTQGQEAVFFLQNKGNILGSTDTDLQDCLPENTDIEQSPTKLDSEANYTSNKKGKELYYGTTDDINDKLLGVQPYVGYTTNELPTSWRFLAFYGELAKDAKSTTPFGITTANPYQSIYYSHAADAAAADYDEVAKQGENSLYEIVKATPLGNLYFEACQDPVNTSLNHFEELLKNNMATQLQFRNFFQEDPEDHSEHVFSRQGFIMFNEGSKFDVNRLVSPKMEGDLDEPYIPRVGNDPTNPKIKESGMLFLGEPGLGLNVDTHPGYSTYAIMGRDYGFPRKATTEYVDTLLEENQTLQYGLHPAELQTRIVGSDIVYEKSLTRKKNDMPARWFNYEQLIGNDDTKDQIKKDIFTLGVECGVDDRELRFNGQYANMPELLASIGTTIDTDGDGNQDALELTADGKIKTLATKTSYLAKTNVAFPWGLYCTEATCQLFDASLGTSAVTWDTIGKKLSAVANENTLKNYAKHFFTQHLGLKYDADDSTAYLFKDGSNDKTLDVFANLTDFCDRDNDLSYVAKVGSDKLAFGTSNMAIDGSTTAKKLKTTAPTPVISEPAICGNERTPAVVGVKVDFDVAPTTSVTLSTDSKGGSVTIPFVGKVSLTGLCSMTVGGGNVDFIPTITLSLQNFFNEELPNVSRDYRVIVEGEIVPIILAKQSFISYDHGFKRTFKNVLLIGGSTTPLSVGDSGTNYGLSPVDIKNNTDFVSTTLVSQPRHFRIDKTMTTLSGSISERQNILLMENADVLRYPITGKNYGTTNVSLDGDHYFHTGSGYAVRISKIVVLGKEPGCNLSELAYMENSNSDWVVNYRQEYADLSHVANCNFRLPVQNTNVVITDGATCRDPRMNHQKNQWMWMTDATRPTRTVPVAYENRFLTRGYDSSTLATLAKYSMETVEDALKNSSSPNKDWEPDFNPGNMVPTASGSYYKSTMANTVSTYFIPNSPISSLWQLGAIHRGKEGQTLNLKSFGTDDSGSITHTYADGDAWILDYLKLNELNPNYGIRGKFNPNCFNRGAYRYLFANIPANTDAKQTMTYANGYYGYPNGRSGAFDANEIQRNTYFRDFIGGAAPSTYVDLESDVFRFKEVGSGKDYPQVTDILAAQSWSPVQAFFNFVEVDGGIGTSSVRTGTAPTTFQCNDRQAESLIGCTAGLLSTRYEVFTVIAVGQSVKYIMNAEEMDNMMTANDVDKTNASERKDFLNKHFVSPIEIDFRNGGSQKYEWYSILSTQVREVTFVRDCWFGKIKVLKSRLL